MCCFFGSAKILGILAPGIGKVSSRPMEKISPGNLFTVGSMNQIPGSLRIDILKKKPAKIGWFVFFGEFRQKKLKTHLRKIQVYMDSGNPMCNIKMFGTSFRKSIGSGRIFFTMCQKK